MLLSHDSQLHEVPATPEPSAWDAPAELAPALRLELPPHAAPHLHRLRHALTRYRTGAQAADLEAGFAAATAVVATVIEPEGTGRPDLEQLRYLAGALPELGELLYCAAGEAERAVRTGTAGLWTTLGLRSQAPGWTPAERDAARMVFACACTPAAQKSPARLQGGLRALAARRFAELLGQELADNEEAWARALGDRYESVRHRCARRTTWRSRGLSELVRNDEISRKAVTLRLERWIANGGVLAGLADELEAALVHARTPARFA